MIDIHSHIIPGVDDGSASLNDSVKMLRAADRNGITDIIATPHSYSIDRIGGDHGRIIGSELDRLSFVAEENSFSVKLHPGEEIIFEPDTVRDLLSGKNITLCKSRYPLIEFMPDEGLDVILFAVDSLVKERFVPIIAHPERYFAIQYDIMNAYEIKERGALLQVNSQSIFGLFGKECARAARHLIFGMYADLIASDSHGPYYRSGDLDEIHELVSNEIDLRYADILLLENPGKVINDEEIFVIGRKKV